MVALYRPLRWINQTWTTYRHCSNLSYMGYVWGYRQLQVLLFLPKGKCFCLVLLDDDASWNVNHALSHPGAFSLKMSITWLRRTTATTIQITLISYAAVGLRAHTKIAQPHTNHMRCIKLWDLSMVIVVGSLDSIACISRSFPPVATMTYQYHHVSIKYMWHHISIKNAG